MKFARWGASALVAALSLPVWAGDVNEAGMEKANTCMGCHGIPGYNNAYPSYRVPKVGGQSAKYLEAALKAYRSGERPHATMHAQAASMSDQDIADVAAYLSDAPAHK
ncbi:MAG: c-type cytochrome [Panacagrimonas sp.]